MANKTTKKATSKKAPRMSASAARAEGAAKQNRMRDAVAVPKDGAPAPKAKASKQRKAKAPKPTLRKRASLLDAAATALADAKAPMQARNIVKAVVERGFWKPGAGKTPHATLYAAMTREIAAKGKNARFRKVNRGQFAAA